MIESWKLRINNRLNIGVMIMDLSKVFDNLNHELLSAKLKTCGLDNNSITLMRSNLTNRRQSCKKITLFVNGKITYWHSTRFYSVRH